MRLLDHLFEKNKAWADRMQSGDPEFFSRLAEQQNPEYLWVGCSDSRVPANQIVDMRPGEVFVHRNVANVVVQTDMNCLSVLQFAIDVLKVKHVIVCGHYGCGGVKAAMYDERHGLVDNWLRHVQRVYTRHAKMLDGLPNEEARLARLCELNVIEQVVNVCRTTIVQDAWMRGQGLSVHGWVYAIGDGRLRDLSMWATSNVDLAENYQRACAARLA
jgi:carbonic anhydrase